MFFKIVIRSVSLNTVMFQLRTNANIGDMGLDITQGGNGK